MREHVSGEVFACIQAFLQAPSAKDTTDVFWESRALIWIDWREYDEAIIDYVNDCLPPNARIEYEVRNSDAPRGIDIFLKKGGVYTAIPYLPEQMDRDTTLRAIQDCLAPAYGLRLYTGSLGCDTLGFCVLPEEQWKQLDTRFGENFVSGHFQPIGPGSVLFGP